MVDIRHSPQRERRVCILNIDNHSKSVCATGSASVFEISLEV